jgi:hypothetical protein
MGTPIEMGVGRHPGPGSNIFSFFINPNSFAAEYKTEMEQVDEATYPNHTADSWRSLRLKPCSWGMGMQRSEKLAHARRGKIIDELNTTCTEIITRKLASGERHVRGHLSAAQFFHEGGDIVGLVGAERDARWVGRRLSMASVASRSAVPVARVSAASTASPLRFSISTCPMKHSRLSRPAALR